MLIFNYSVTGGFMCGFYLQCFRLVLNTNLIASLTFFGLVAKSVSAPRILSKIKMVVS